MTPSPSSTTGNNFLYQHPFENSNKPSQIVSENRLLLQNPKNTTNATASWQEVWPDMVRGTCFDVAFMTDRIATIHMRSLTLVKSVPFVRLFFRNRVRHVTHAGLISLNARWLSTLAASTSFITIATFNIPKSTADKIVVQKVVSKVFALLRKNY